MNIADYKGIGGGFGGGMNLSPQKMHIKNQMQNQQPIKNNQRASVHKNTSEQRQSSNSNSGVKDSRQQKMDSAKDKGKNKISDVKQKAQDKMKDAKNKLAQGIMSMAAGVLANGFMSKLGGLVGQVPAMGVISKLTSVAMVMDGIHKVMESLNGTMGKLSTPQSIEKRQAQTDEVTTDSTLGKQLGKTPTPIAYSDDGGKKAIKDAGKLNMKFKNQQTESYKDSLRTSNLGEFKGSFADYKKSSSNKYNFNNIGTNKYKFNNR